MPYNTIDEYRDLPVSIDRAGEPDHVLEAWATDADGGLTTGPLSDGIGNSALVSGWVTIYDPERDWPIVHRAPLRAVDEPNPNASLPWVVGDRRIYRWSNPDDGIGSATLDRPIIALGGDLYCRVEGGEAIWL
jgi:hypothetical protein